MGVVYNDGNMIYFTVVVEQKKWRKLKLGFLHHIGLCIEYMINELPRIIVYSTFQGWGRIGIKRARNNILRQYDI